MAQLSKWEQIGIRSPDFAVESLQPITALVMMMIIKLELSIICHNGPLYGAQTEIRTLQMSGNRLRCRLGTLSGVNECPQSGTIGYIGEYKL